MNAVELAQRLHQHRAWVNGNLLTTAASFSDEQLRLHSRSRHSGEGPQYAAASDCGHVARDDADFAGSTGSGVVMTTILLHSRDDDVIPFADSDELARNSRATLIDVGNDHRLADRNPLAAMLKACEDN